MVLSDKFIVSTIGGENVILPIDNECVDYNSVFMLNDTGMFIVSSLPASREDIIERLLLEYDVERSTATSAVDDFIGELRKYGMLDE